MSNLTVDAIRRCLDGDIPASIATCAQDGTPNVTLLSQVQYIDAEHVALSYQFFNKTRKNILVNPFACLELIDPCNGAVYQLSLQYLRTETAGPLFENMKAKLAGIASHTGMSGVFRLLGADIYRVLAVQAIPGATLPELPQRNLLSATRACCEHLAAGGEMNTIIDRLFADLEIHFGLRHGMMLVYDDAARRLYTVASRGYENSGVGSEIALGDGVIGVAARERTPIRITRFTSDYVYGRAIQDSSGGPPDSLERKIPFPGLAEPHSQLAVPVMAQGNLLGILFAENAQDRSFGYDEEDALATVAAQLGLALLALQHGAGSPEDGGEDKAASVPPSGATAIIRHYAADDSLFIDDDYLIKGVAGAIFWKLLRDHAGGRRSDFTNKELRLDPALRLPALSENLEARLILLERRLAERCAFMRLEKTGRGRFRLVVRRPVRLIEIPDGADG